MAARGWKRWCNVYPEEKKIPPSFTNISEDNIIGSSGGRRKLPPGGVSTDVPLHKSGPKRSERELKIPPSFTNISEDNIIKSSGGRRKPQPRGVPSDVPVQNSEPRRSGRERGLHGKHVKGKSGVKAGLESSKAEFSRNARSRGKKGANFQSDTQVAETINDSGRPTTPDEFESVIVVETPKRRKTKRRFSQAGSPVEELNYQCSGVDRLESSRGLHLRRVAAVGGLNANETSSPNTQIQIENEEDHDGQSASEDGPMSTIVVQLSTEVRCPEPQPGSSEANARPTRSSIRRLNKASSYQSTSGRVTGGLINTKTLDTVGGWLQRTSLSDGVVNSTANTAAADSGVSKATKAFNEELDQNNLEASTSQRSGRALSSTGIHGQSRLDDSQFDSPLVGQTTPRRQLRSSALSTTSRRQAQTSFHQSANSSQGKSGILQAQESSMVLPSTSRLSSSLLDSSNITSLLFESEPITTFQTNTSIRRQQGQRIHNTLITGLEDMASSSIQQRNAIELDGESSSDLSDVDSKIDFTEIEAAFQLNSDEPELAVEQEPSSPSAKPRSAGQKKPASKAMQKQQKPASKKPRANAPKEKNVMQKAAARAKAATRKTPAKPRLPKAATRASGRKNIVEAVDKEDDYQPGNGVGFAISESEMGLRDRSKLKAPVTYDDRIKATADLMQTPAAKTGLKMVVPAKKTRKPRATRASATTSNVQTRPKKQTTSLKPSTPRQLKKLLPKSTKCAESRLSPNDSGFFSEAASTASTDEEVRSEFAPPSITSSDATLASSVISPTSPEADAEDEVDDELSLPEIAQQRARKNHSHFDTGITVNDANARTDPPVGPELLELARKAQDNGQIAGRWNPEVARFVGGIWMAPDVCDSCWQDKSMNCDRAFPCYHCVKNGKTCNLRTVMVRSKCNTNPPHDGAATSLHLNSLIISQNGDGTWNAIKQAPPTTRPKKRKRDDANKETTKRQGRRKAPHTYTPYHKSEQENLPDPYGQPPVWATKRQELCETLPYYRAYMSGGYINNGLVRAFLIDKEVRRRDVFDEEIIITRCGGGRTLDEKSNMMRQATDQEKSQGNSKSPSKLPHYYNVLDWFHVTEVWVEKVEGFRTWCVRMEKIRLDEKSWWAKAGSALPSPHRDLDAIKAASGTCISCETTSKVIFEQGWTCLRTYCDKFFIFGSPVDDTQLTYAEAFLNERTAFRGKAPGPLAPPLVTEADLVITGQRGTEFAFKRGIVCPLCKRCNRRLQWSKWACETVNCGFTHSLPFKIMSVKDTMEDMMQSHAQHNYELNFGIKFEAKTIGAYNVYEYGVPGPNGNIVGFLRLFRSTAAINRQPDGPDDLFRLMQESDFDLRRRPVRQANTSGEVITNHFATNWGAPYKFVVAQSSRGFNEAPTVIVKALKRLTWAGQQTLTDVGEPFHPFNELLSIGYFQDCTIGYHDDGESTLGPTVATLSLGASALMSLRPKAKADLGPPSKNAKGSKAAVIRVTLEHGDMVIMHRSGVQQYYEHEVVPNGTLRFALTSRYIRPETLDNDAQREEARIKGALPEGHEQYQYNGDENPIFTEEEIEKSKKAERLSTFMRKIKDAMAIYSAGASVGDDDERCQMRDIIGEEIQNHMGKFGNGGFISGEVGEPIHNMDSGRGVDVPMANAS
ncbi:hypothetical protein V495_07155 [Pseudogymnoascus sp. VKM F-4514 (FW-929)]|nr:hypothetical protein V495_07155 [Pseudogymnoascus sp. VKM F-4514 (FW-929)]KFY53835.1 hypothetical protein V497_08232 [Pseudogymnoascus sp. VKM F-4516 (FW-969)]